MRPRLFVVLLILAAAGAFGAGWWLRGRSGPSPEERTREATERVRDAFKALTR